MNVISFRGRYLAGNPEGGRCSRLRAPPDKPGGQGVEPSEFPGHFNAENAKNPVFPNVLGAPSTGFPQKPHRFSAANAGAIRFILEFSTPLLFHIHHGRGGLSQNRAL
jgi:hypothetical protein